MTPKAYLGRFRHIIDCSRMTLIRIDAPADRIIGARPAVHVAKGVVHNTGLIDLGYKLVEQRRTHAFGCKTQIEQEIAITLACSPCEPLGF